MNAVLASARTYEIEPFYSMPVPKIGDFDQRQFQQFEHDVEHYVTQLVLNNSFQKRRDSVEILPKSKDSIRSYVHGLRECIEASNMTVAKREALLKRLDDFERELEKRRTSLLSVALLTFELLAVPGGVWASYDIAAKLITNMMQTVAESKAEEKEGQPVIAAQAPLKALMPPRPESPTTKRQSFSDELDDDVPF
jgi:hypothetical protein